MIDPKIEPKWLQSFMNDTRWFQTTKKQADYASSGLSFKELLALVETSADENGSGYVNPFTGDSINKIYKADGFNEDNPAYVVKGTRNGEEYETTQTIWNYNDSGLLLLMPVSIAIVINTNLARSTRY